MLFIILILFVFHFDISGNESKDEQFSNIESISITLQVFQIDMLCIEDNDIHLLIILSLHYGSHNLHKFSFLSSEYISNFSECL